jgi:hypothetical protein
LVNGLGQGMFSSPNVSAIMGSVPVGHRGAASGMRTTFQNSGTALSIGIFFSLLTVGLAHSMPPALAHGMQAHGVPASTAHAVAHLPPVTSVFAAFLGANPIEHLLSGTHALNQLSPADSSTLTGPTFFPNIVSGPFHSGLMVVFGAATVMSVAAAFASFSRGRASRRYEDEAVALSANTSIATE